MFFLNNNNFYCINDEEISDEVANVETDSSKSNIVLTRGMKKGNFQNEVLQSPISRASSVSPKAAYTVLL